jgi:copper homeostasis protein
LHLKNYFLESCVTSLADALDAETHGADRLEVCSRLETEGMTPDFELVKSILEKTKIPIRIMIRETEDGYEADQNVLQKMVSSIHQFKTLPIDGFVFGLLKNNKVDREGMQLLLKNADPYHVTFHKALDMSIDKWNDIEWINDQIQIDTILTSGGEATAMQGVEELVKTKALFKGEIMAAGKITNDQLSPLHEKLKLKWYHGRNIL